VGTTLGSLFYMSPEQVQAGELDGRSDLYSVGVSLYELVTGDRPFKGNSDYELMVAQLQQIPMPPIQLRPDLPEALNNVIMTAMEKDPARRYQSAQDFAAALANVCGEPGVTPTVVAPAPPAEMTAGYAATGATNAYPAPPPVGPPETPSPIPVPPPVVQPPPPAAASKSYRGLYMTLGALIALGVIVLGATQIPRLLKTRAGGEQAASAPAAASSNAQPSQTADNSQRAPMAGFGGGANTTGADQNAASPASPGAPSSTQVPSAGAAPTSSAMPSGAPTSTALTQSPASAASAPTPANQSVASSSAAPMGSGGSIKKSARASRVSSKAAPASMLNSDSNTPSAPETPAPAGGQEVAPTAAPPTPAPPSADQAKALEELRDRMTTQSSRAAAMKDSVENLRQRQTAQGFTLRPDISASMNRMEQYMTKADAAINSGDADGAKKYADLAEREIEKLEKFFGR